MSFTIALRAAAVTAISALAGCGGDKMPVDGGPNSGLCPVTLHYRETGSTPRVFAAGSWNSFSETADELRDDGAGDYTLTLTLRPGLYAYKLVVTGDGGEPWRLDPHNPYRTYSGGVENSGLRVADCTTPRLVVESTSSMRAALGDGRLSATLRYQRRLAGPLRLVTGELRSGATARSLDGTELTWSGDAVQVELSGLPDGKHTVSLAATDTAGALAESVLLPFWIEAEPFDWQDALVYLVVTDRFRNGDTANDPAPVGASTGADYYGGDLVGVRQAIEEGYMDDLGVRALWLTPYNQNPVGTFGAADGIHQVTGYHGYWPIAPRAVDPRLGGEQALEDLVRAAHARGIRVLMDLVLNHVHQEHPYVRDHPDWFNTGCICGTAGCDWTARRLDCLFRDYMPDVNWENPDAAEQMIADSLYWLERFDLDGFRVDAVKHVVDGAAINLSVRVRERFETAGTRYFLMGETAQGWDSGAGPAEGGNVDNYGIISRYIGPDSLDGQFDFVLYYAGALQFLRDDPGRGMSHVDFWTRASMAQYPRGAIMTPYIGSHDTARFITLTSDPVRANNKWADLPLAPATPEPYDRMYVALAWLMAVPGAPLLYYGDEYGEPGGADPDNRRPMRFGAALTARETAQLTRVQRLGQARAALPGLRRGGYRTLLVTDDLWCIARGTGAELVVVVLNRAAAPTTVTVPIPRALAADGHVLTDALGSATAATVSRAAITVTVAGRSALYLGP